MNAKSERELFALSNNESFLVMKSSLAYLLDSPVRISHGLILLCLNGKGKLTVNFEKYVLGRNSQLILLPQSIITLNDKSENFETICFSFSLSVFNEAFFLIDSGLFEFLKNNPLFTFSDEIFQERMCFFTIIQSIYNDRENKYRNKIATNYLQNFFLDIFDKIDLESKKEKSEDVGRKEELFKKFVQSVFNNFIKAKEVRFYANELSISTRYLSLITQRIDNSTAKEFIDNCVVQEIKLLLHSSNLSIQEISDYLNFPDQSNFSRFFKKKTGISPTEYRKRKDS